MTKSELKSIIMECLEEEGILTEAVVDEDELALENAMIVEESCMCLVSEAMTEEEFIAATGHNFKSEDVKKLATQLLYKNAKAYKDKHGCTMEEAMKTVKGETTEEAKKTVIAKISAAAKDMDPKKKAAVIAGSAALISAGIAAAIVAAKKKDKEEEKKEEK